MVGKTGFEPATPWSQTMCSTKLSYFPIFKYIMARPRGVEPLTFWSVVKRSIQLSYGRNQFHKIPLGKNGAEDGIRTRDPHLGKVMFYHWTTSASKNVMYSQNTASDNPKTVLLFIQ